MIANGSHHMNSSSWRVEMATGGAAWTWVIPSAVKSEEEAISSKSSIFASETPSRANTTSFVLVAGSHDPSLTSSTSFFLMSSRSATYWIMSFVLRLHSTCRMNCRLHMTGGIVGATVVNTVGAMVVVTGATVVVSVETGWAVVGAVVLELEGAAVPGLLVAGDDVLGAWVGTAVLDVVEFDGEEVGFAVGELVLLPGAAVDGAVVLTAGDVVVESFPAGDEVPFAGASVSGGRVRQGQLTWYSAQPLLHVVPSVA